MLQKAGHRKNTIFSTILTFRYIQCLHLMYAEVAWVLGNSSSATSNTRSRLPPDYLSICYDYDIRKQTCCLLYLSIHHFLARFQRPTCITYGKCLLESIMVMPTPKLLCKCDQASDLWQQLELVSELEFDL